MKIEQRQWTPDHSWKPQDSQLNKDAQLVFIFGERNLLKDGTVVKDIRSVYPNAFLFGCSTSGEIQQTQVFDNTVTTTAVRFDKTTMSKASLRMSEVEGNSVKAGEKLATSIDHKDLSHVFVLSVGLGVNGSELVQGLASKLPPHVTLTGGLAGDQDRFQETLVIAGTEVHSDMIVIVGLYGKSIKVASASLGGWDPFGPERLVTKAKGNVLYELDGQSALQIYKKYLGEYAKDLPGSGLLFPLCLRTEGKENVVVRTILAVDEKDQSMTFAGDVPLGCYGRFMKANFDRLVEGAMGAASKCLVDEKFKPELALLISCVGRKLILKQRVEEEVEGVRDILGSACLTGFYSYGEISPFTPEAKCELHNQTMTITALSEV